jgi:hypothetical protein
MKMKKLGLLGAAVLTVVCSLGLPANAGTYDVSFMFSGFQDNTPAFQPPGGMPLGTITVTGTIVTNCDNCALMPGNVTSWSFMWGGMGAGSASGNSGNIQGINNLSASGGEILFNPFTPTFLSEGSFTDPSSGANVWFGAFQDGTIGCGNAFNNCIKLTNSTLGFNSVGTVNFTGEVPSFEIATERVVTTTPLPAALPLFAGGLSAMGLLGWRRKRKAQAA